MTANVFQGKVAKVDLSRGQVEYDKVSDEDARRLARSVLGGVAVTALLLSALGVILAPWITGILLAASDEPTRDLTTKLVRILFPMSGVLIIGAWFLGVLNTHGRFFLPFAAPAIWNLSQVAGLLLAARLGSDRLAEALAWSALIGAVLQVGIQIPRALELSKVRRPGIELSYEPVRRVARNTLPVISSQGVLQISSLVDIMLASLAGAGAMAALGYSQRLAYLPISLFGMSVAAAALPAMSRDPDPAALRERLVNGWFQILFFVLPASLVLLLFGDLAVRLVYQRGEFGQDSTSLVAAVLAAYAIGLVAASSIKLFAAGFHAMQDTATPMRVAVVSVGVGVGVPVSVGVGVAVAVAVADEELLGLVPEVLVGLLVLDPAGEVDAEEFGIPASVLFHALLQGDAVHRTGHRAQVAGDAALLTVRVPGQDNAAAIARCQVGHLLRILDRF